MCYVYAYRFPDVQLSSYEMLLDHMVFVYVLNRMRNDMSDWVELPSEHFIVPLIVCVCPGCGYNSKWKFTFHRYAANNLFALKIYYATCISIAGHKHHCRKRVVFRCSYPHTVLFTLREWQRKIETGSTYGEPRLLSGLGLHTKINWNH